MSENTTVGVIVGRFQVPKLHAGHRFLIDHVCRGHEDVLIVIGSTHAYLDSKNPLDYETRRAMIRDAYPNVRIAEIKDCRYDDIWSQMLDAMIAKQFPGRKAVLYGSRGSFIPSYSGLHPCVTIKSANPKLSATDIRSNIVEQPPSTKQFRSGMIYAASRRPPLSYQTVDVAIVDYDRKRLLLGKRNSEHGALRFIGGFVDPHDPSLEYAARRETFEETRAAEVTDFRYLASFRIRDWRYRNASDGILTAFFAAHYVFGATRAADDLDSLEWMEFDDFAERLVPEHKPLGEKLKQYLASITLEKGNQL